MLDWRAKRIGNGAWRMGQGARHSAQGARQRMEGGGEGEFEIGKAAREAGIYLAIGVIERDRDYGGGNLNLEVGMRNPERKKK